MRGENVWGLVRGAGGVVRALGWRRPLLQPGVPEETSRDICKNNKEVGEKGCFGKKDARGMQMILRDVAAAAAAAAAASPVQCR
jgi:hypothetical protein